MFAATFFTQWKHWYDHSTATSAAITFAHLGGLLLGGGSAVVADLGTLRVVGLSSRSRIGHLIDLGRTHQLVTIGLGTTIVSGLLMFAADVDTLAASPVFWLKMVLLGGLIANGVVLARTERGLNSGRLPETTGWPRLCLTARTSLGLWFALLLLGTLLRTA
jgi:hypothetical protein